VWDRKEILKYSFKKIILQANKILARILKLGIFLRGHPAA
jgi:hypothetical protein